jgi:hypothetical protein
MASEFTVHETNPNDTIGGGGCLCAGGAISEDCEGPFINFFRVSTEFDASPYAVICAKHLRHVAETFEFEERLEGGDVHPLRETKREPNDLAPAIAAAPGAHAGRVE